MPANTILVVERQFPYPQAVLFDAFTVPEQMSAWRGSPGWHVDTSSLTSELQAGGRHHHVKVRESDGLEVTTDAVFTEFFRPDVFVARQRITGDDNIDPDAPLELRVEFTKIGRGAATLVRVIQGPYDESQTEAHATAWRAELDRLDSFLTTHQGATR